MPSNSSPAKIAATRTYGAHISFSGPTAPEREALTASVMAQTGARLVPPYDHPDIILGAGTAALELQSQVPARTRLDAVITPCGGGGLLSGTALACSPSSSNDVKPIHVFGAEPSHLHLTDDCARGLALGRRIPAVPASDTIADGLRTPVGEIPWSVIHDRKLVRGVYTAGEAEIKRALRLVYERMKVVVEPSAVVGLAVALFNEEFRAMVEREGGEEGWDLGVVFSGGNVSLDVLGGLFAETEGSK